MGPKRDYALNGSCCDHDLCNEHDPQNTATELPSTVVRPTAASTFFVTLVYELSPLYTQSQLLTSFRQSSEKHLVFPWGVFQSCVGKAQKVVIAVYRIIFAQCYFRLLHLQTVSFRLEFARTQLCLKGDTCTCILRHENSTSFKFACW